jgi:tripartite-type tricarboxylate transporter receptor subunit TctC
MTGVKFPHRRQFLHLAAGAAALPAVSRIARAQAHPTRPVRIVVGLPAGGNQDVIARLIAPWLSERLGQQVIIDNHPSGSNNIAAEAVIRSPPDGYTLLLVGSYNAINATLYDKLGFDFLRDTTPVASLIRVPSVLDVNPSVPAKTVLEFIAYAKANPGKLTMASAGSGTPPHIAGELFKMMTGVNMLHVPYRGGGPALIDLLGGQVQVLFGGLPASIEHIRAGKLRALAVTTVERSPALPDIPTVANFVPGYEASTFFGLSAPRATPPEIVERLNREINAALADPIAKAPLADLGGTALALSPADFGKLIAEETEKWAKVIRAANIKPQ